MLKLNNYIMNNDFHYPLMRSTYSNYYNNIPGLDRDKDEVEISTEAYIDYMDNWVDVHLMIAYGMYGDCDTIARKYLIEDLMYYAENFKI